MSGSALLAAVTPTSADLATWKGLESEEELDAPAELVQKHLQLSTAMFLLATGMTKIPDWSSPIGHVIRAGILDMAWYIGTTKENQDEIFSPFSSERIGSYSYSKAVKAVQRGEDTDVPFFDMAVKWFKESVFDGSGTFGLSSEHVFSQPYGSVPVRPAPDFFPLAPPEGGSEVGDPVLDYIALFEEGR